MNIHVPVMQQCNLASSSHTTLTQTTQPTNEVYDCLNTISPQKPESVSSPVSTTHPRTSSEAPKSGTKMQRTPQPTSVLNLVQVQEPPTHLKEAFIVSLQTIKKFVLEKDGIPLESGARQHKGSAGPKAASNKLFLPKRTK